MSYSGICRHCGERKICRPRQLCQPCHRSERIRKLYPSTHSAAYRGEANHNLTTTLPDPTTATSAKPGSAEKVAVMSARAAAGLSLYHPDDETTPIEPFAPAEPTSPYAPGIREVRYHGGTVRND